MSLESDVHRSFYGQLMEAKATITALTTENERLRGQVVKWRDGGAFGQSEPIPLPEELSVPGCDLLLVVDGELVKAWTADFDGDICFDEGPMRDGFHEWSDVEYYIPLSDFPLPDSEVQGE